MILIDLIIAGLFVLLITTFICMVFDASYTESVLIGVLILIIAVQKIDTLRIVDTSPIMSLIISAAAISVVGVFLSVVVHQIDI